MGAPSGDGGEALVVGELGALHQPEEEREGVTRAGIAGDGEPTPIGAVEDRRVAR